MGSRLPLISYGLCLGVAGAVVFAATACNEHPVDVVGATGAVEHVEPHNLGGGQKLDLLWTIDNSGSMCRSQNILRDGIDDFVDILGEVNIDFHIGVTTTHMRGTRDEDDLSFEPIARPGHLQSTPQPLPGSEEVCYHSIYKLDDPEVEQGDAVAGEPNYEDLDPLYESIDVAVECTEDPSQWEHLKNVPEDELRCAIRTTQVCDPDTHDPDAHYCECPDDPDVAADFANCIDCADDADIEDFFPDSDAYRDIPLVLRSEDYEADDGTLEVERLRDDFACMSLVGTRGWGYEQGLNAVVTAASKELTGGPKATSEDRDEHPNAGFFRQDANTGLIFVSDENDCSHDGSLERNICGVHECTIQEALGEDGAMIGTEDLAREFMENLAETRDLDYDNDALTELSGTVLPASIHGRHQDIEALLERIPDDEIPPACPDTRRDWVNNYFSRHAWNWIVPPSCRGELGVAWSGHRYEEFIRHFDNFFPMADPDDPDAPLDGHICQDFTPILTEIADFFSAEAAGCIDNVYRCHGPDDTSCPEHPILDKEGTCTAYPGADEDDGAQYYCDTGVEVRLMASSDDHQRQDLEDTGYCLDGSFDEPGFVDSCVIDPDRYSWESCDTRDDGLLLTWQDPNWLQQIGEFNAVIRYTSFSSSTADEES